MPRESDDFADVLQRAQRVTPGDVGSPFPQLDASRAGQAANRAKGVPDLDYEAHAKVFGLPADAADYEDAMNLCLRGDAVLRYEERTFDKEGNFLVAMVYLTPRPRAAQANGAQANDVEPEVRPGKLPTA